MTASTFGLVRSFRGFLPAAAGLTALAASAADMPQGLVLHLGFSEPPTNGVVADSSGRGNHGKATGTQWTAGGRVGGACVFDGAGQFIAVPASPSLDARQITFMAWVRAADGVVGRTILDRQPDQGFALAIGSDSKAGGTRGRALFTVAGHACYGDSVIADNFWHHLAATYDGETLKLYVDGAAQKQTAAWKGEVGAAGKGLTIGMNKSSATPDAGDTTYQGTLDEVRIFDRALTGPDITAIYSASKPKFTKFEVGRRMAELKDLKDRGLLLDGFYERKMKECEQ